MSTPAAPPLKEVPPALRIRIFGDAAVQAAIDAALAQLPAGKKGAVIAYADGNTVRLAVTARIAEGWSAVGVLAGQYGGKLEGAAAIRFSW